MNDLNKVIKRYGPGSCPNCGNDLILLNSEMILSQLNEYGIVVSSKIIRTQLVAKCKFCEKQIKMKRIGLYIIPDYKIRRELDYDEKILDEFSSKVVKGTNKDNPFKEDD